MPFHTLIPRGGTCNDAELRVPKRRSFILTSGSAYPRGSASLHSFIHCYCFCLIEFDNKQFSSVSVLGVFRCYYMAS